MYGKGHQRRKRFFRKDTILMFGPAWLAMMADMDVSSYIGAAQTGATFGYGLIWIMLVLIVPLYIVQELAGRISIATGEGLGSVIRKNYGMKTSVIASFPMALTDMTTYAIEYIGMGIALEIMGIPLIFSIPVIYVIHILVVSKKKYSQAEKPLLIISAALIFALLVSVALRGIIPLSSPIANPVLVETDPSYFFLLAANVGAVIMPFMIFFQASATGIKTTELDGSGIRMPRERSLRIMRKETLLGAVVTELMMVLAEMAFTGIDGAAHSSFFASPSTLSKVLTPVAGSLSPYILGIGLIAAGFIALIVISLGSAWGIAESLNINQRSYWMLYVAESLPAAIVAMFIDPLDLIRAVLYLLIFFVFALVPPLILLWVIGTNKKIMGDHALSPRESKLFITLSTIIIFTAILATFTA